MRHLIALVASLVMIAGCGANATGDADVAAPADSTPLAATQPAEPPAAMPSPASTPREPEDITAGEADDTTAPSESPQLSSTPALPEGDYYPPEQERPSDRDADLLLLSGSPAIATGNPIVLEGQLLDMEGSPVEGASIEIWQADSQGIYLHPEDPRTNARDPYFQSYGTATTDTGGRWTFRTVAPAPSDDRARHIHVKVRRNDRELLTTQIFFAGDPNLADDPLLAELDEDLAALLIRPAPGTDADNRPVSLARHTLVVDLTP